MTRKDIKRIAQRRLKEAGEPTKCHRCSGGPGDPVCGKVIHIILDAAFDEVARQHHMMTIEEENEERETEVEE